MQVYLTQDSRVILSCKMAAFMNLRGVKHYRDRRDISPDLSKRLLRFESESVEFITTYFLDENTDARGGGLTARKKMEIFLRYVSDPGYQSGVANDVGVERSTVSKIFASVLDKIVAKSSQWIKFPSSIEDMDQAKTDWASKFRIPTAIGAVDCTHVHIMKPSVFGDEYVNRKGKTTINVQMTCDANEKITSVDAQWPGSVHDSRIWRMSGVLDVVRRHDGDVSLLGDSGYSITPWLLTPFDEPRNAHERKYNVTHAQERVIIERVFGQLKRRFPILSSQVRIRFENIPKLVISCAVLHNIAKHLNDAWELEDVIENAIDEGDDVPVHNLDRNEVRIRRRGQQKRREISNNL